MKFIPIHNLQDSVQLLHVLWNSKAFDFRNTQISDASQFSDPQKLKIVDRCYIKISDISAFSSVTNLQCLHLSTTQIFTHTSIFLDLQTCQIF
mmetsp:Transcript_8106/g.14682  ORF Transcript_8106/g.14682 Transcript_8106/m.14682 type:complete len:93 (+) Transcript_8106:207-485(+)